MAKPKYARVQMPHGGNLPHGLSFRVPWRIHAKAWEVYAEHHPDQSAERINERGGFGIEELIYLLAGEDPFAAKDEPMASDFFRKFKEQ